MSTKNKYNYFIDLYNLPDVSEKYSKANDLEKTIISMRTAGWTYGSIQLRLGNPSKKYIRSVLLTYAPELIDNSTSKQNKYVSAYSELYNILLNTDRINWNIFGDDSVVEIKGKQVYYDGDPLSNWSEAEQSQILEEIKKQL